MAAMCVSVSLGFLPALAFGTLRNGKAFSRSLRICWETLDSLVVSAGRYAYVPAGTALAVDREIFSDYIAKKRRVRNSL